MRRILSLASAAALAGLGCCSGSGSSSARQPPDQIVSLPEFGPPKTKHFAGLADATPDGKNKLFYWFVEAEVGSSNSETPLLLWFNGGPGASSLIGLLSENLGPHRITASGTLVENAHAITKLYHLMAIDNPVGSGYSATEDGAFVKTADEMRTQVVHALRGFFKRHPEYEKNPLWIMGESYAGKYVPNIGCELARNATDIRFQGVIIGNGIYDARVQYTTIGEMAYGAGVIGNNLLKQVEARQEQCLAAIDAGRRRAGDFCENETVRWLFTPPSAVAGELFYYDFGFPNPKELDALTDSMGRYLNRADVKHALHVDNATWVCADEVGPVAENLRADFTIPSTPQVKELLKAGKQVFMYNGVRDGSVCNHIGNLKVLLGLDWHGASEFEAAMSVPWPSSEEVRGHVRGFSNLHYATVMRTGHLVPTVVPESYAVMLEMALKKTVAQVTATFVV
jgi:carboxypeptidase C (cathepsin A)